MRDGRCPKCDGREIATTRHVLYAGAKIGGPTVDLYACADCRYVEQYMADNVREKVAVLEHWSWVGREDGGPFRR